MCGIAGKIYFNDHYVTRQELGVMAHKVAHRGPDDEGFYISPDRKLGFAHRRLSIIDLSYNGHQPMNYKKRYWITFNGEIYNFESERKKLEKLGYRFKSATDTEVILALFDKYKTKCLQYLRGMFAFAIYDEKEKVLFIARDRVGKKPLKYYFDQNVFIFASELKAILTQKEVKKEPDFIAIHHFLTYGYVPPPATGFKGLKKLEPAHFMLINLKNKTVIKKRYWKLNFSKKLKLSEAEWQERIFQKLEEATKMRLIADVPIGVFLSGGIDSSSIVALMAKMLPSKIRTFTIAFKDKRFDESMHARKIANLFGTNHQELVTEPASIESLPGLVKHLEEPFADNSTIVTHLISKLAKKHVKVVLNGDAGDENFAGYSRFNRLKRDVVFDQYFGWSLPLTKPLSRQLADLTDAAILKRISKYLYKAEKNLAERYLSYFGYFTSEEKQSLYSDHFKKETLGVNSYFFYQDKMKESEASDPCDQLLYGCVTAFLPEDLLVKVDMASMREGIEGRSPFVDHEFMQIAAQIPFGLKIKRNINKYILKKTLKGILPAEIINRPKIGFTIPLGAWFTGKFNSYARSRLLKKGSISSLLFNKSYIKHLLSTHSEKNDYGVKLWTLLVLQIWFDEYFPSL